MRHLPTGKELERSGGERETTNNRMELLGAIRALEALKESCRVTLYSDSKYLVDAFNLMQISLSHADEINCLNITPLN